MVKYNYDAWGRHTITDGNGNPIMDSSHIAYLNPFRYRGYYYDTETRLYYLNTRYYDPEVGRFISQDDIDYADPESINGLNLYAYCGNNPVMNVDPTGTSFWDWIVGAFLFVVGAVLCFVPGAQGAGIALGIAGGSMISSAALTAGGVNGKTASIISSVGDIVVGSIITVFTPFKGFGASMIGSGIGGIVGGYVSESLGGSFELGAGIGNVVGSILGGKIYDIINIAKIVNAGSVVIGEGMGRVHAMAAKTGSITYGGLPKFERLSAFLPKTIMNQLGLAHNARWIRWVARAGVNIIDIGPIGNNSPNYLMEILYIMKWLF